jgi:hypothetical protein
LTKVECIRELQNDYRVINGKATLFVDEGSDERFEVALARIAIREAMGIGDFDNLHPSISCIAYWNGIDTLGKDRFSTPGGFSREQEQETVQAQEYLMG